LVPKSIRQEERGITESKTREKDSSKDKDVVMTTAKIQRSKMKSTVSNQFIL
jgi:hypothetical protein